MVAPPPVGFIYGYGSPTEHLVLAFCISLTTSNLNAHTISTKVPVQTLKQQKFSCQCMSKMKGKWTTIETTSYFTRDPNWPSNHKYPYPITIIIHQRHININIPHCNHTNNYITIHTALTNLVLVPKIISKVVGSGISLVKLIPSSLSEL